MQILNCNFAKHAHGKTSSKGHQKLKIGVFDQPDFHSMIFVLLILSTRFLKMLSLSTNDNHSVGHSKLKLHVIEHANFNVMPSMFIITLNF